jgi:hypothetical protein
MDVTNFTNVVGADAAARLRLTPDGQGVIAKGKSLKGRAVAWLKEAFGGGKDANRAAILAFRDAVQDKYGARAADAVAEQLQARYSQGRPLRMRHVEQAIGTAKDVVATRTEALATRASALATRLADLGDGTDTHKMIEDLVSQGALSRAGANALRTPGNDDHVRLKEDIMRAVREAAPQNEDQPLKWPTAVLTTKRVLDEAARRITTAANTALAKPLATELADPGGDTPASAMLKDLVARSALSSEGAGALFRADSEHHVQLKAQIQKAVRNAISDYPQPLTRSEASRLAETTINQFMESKAAVLGRIAESDLPKEAKAELSLSAMTNPEAKTVRYADQLVNLTKDAMDLFGSLQGAKTDGDFVHALHDYTEKLPERMEDAGLKAFDQGELMDIMDATMKAGVAGLADSPGQAALQDVLHKLVGEPGRALIKGLAATCLRSDFLVNPLRPITDSQYAALRRPNLAGASLARNLAERLDASPEAAAGLMQDLTSSEGINTVDDLPGAVYGFAREQGVKLKLKPEHVQTLADQMDHLVSSITNAKTPRALLDAQIAAQDAASRVCRAAGVKLREEQEALVAEAFDTWAAGLPDGGEGLQKMLLATLTDPLNLRLTAAVGPLDGLDRFVKNLAVTAARRSGKQGEELANVGRQFDQTAARVSTSLQFAEEKGLLPPVPTLSERQTGSFSDSGLRIYQGYLDEQLQNTAPPGSPLNDQFLKDFKRASEFQLGDEKKPFPPIEAVDERLQRIDAFFGEDLAGKQAVTQVTHQNTVNPLAMMLSRTPYGPFRATFAFASDDADPPPRFEINRTADQGYRVAFTYPLSIRNVSDPIGASMTMLNRDTSRLRLEGEFEISRDSIDQGQPRAEVTSLTYEYELHPPKDDRT